MNIWFQLQDLFYTSLYGKNSFIRFKKGYIRYKNGKRAQEFHLYKFRKKRQLNDVEKSLEPAYIAKRTKYCDPHTKLVQTHINGQALVNQGFFVFHKEKWFLCKECFYFNGIKNGLEVIYTPKISFKDKKNGLQEDPVMILKQENVYCMGKLKITRLFDRQGFLTSVIFYNKQGRLKESPIQMREDKSGLVKQPLKENRQAPILKESQKTSFIKKIRVSSSRLKYILHRYKNSSEHTR